MWLVMVVLLFVMCGVVGYKKGLVEIIVGLLAGIMATILVAVISPILAQLIIDNTAIDEGITQVIVENILANEEVADQVEVSDEVQAIVDIRLPYVLQEKVIENNTAQMYRDLGVDSFFEYVGSYIARWVIRITTFIITLLAVLIFMKIFLFSLLVIAHAPMLGSLNKIGGFIVGGLGAVVILWLIFILADLLHQMQWATEFVDQVTKYKVFEIIYIENPIMTLLSR